MAEIYKEMIKAGVLGAVLAWALWENSKINDRLFLAIENNSRILGKVEKALSGFNSNAALAGYKNAAD